MNALKFLLITFLMVSCVQEKESTTAFFADITESVYASGKVISKDQYNVFSPNAGEIINISVEEGMDVEEGQVLLNIKNETSELSALNAKAALDLAKKNRDVNSAQLEELRLQKSTASQKLTTDSINYFRQKSLFDQQIGSKTQLEMMELAYRNSRNQVSIIEQKITSLQDRLDFDLEQAENNYQMARSRSNDFYINSKMIGTVLQLNKEVGELVIPQEVIAVIGNSKEFLIELEIDEEDITRVNQGKKVFITMDAYKDQVFEATIHKIYPMMNQQNQSFKVEAQFTDSPDVLYPYLSVEANILIQEKKNVMVIPREYYNDNKSVVKDNDSTIMVTPGIIGPDFVEITEGLDTSTLLIKPE